MVVLTLAVGSTRYPHTRKDHGKLTYDKQLTALLVIDPPSVPIWESEGAVIILIVIGKMPHFRRCSYT
jgi:hypothetical protein